MSQVFAQDVVNVFNPKYKPRGSEEKDLFTLQLYYVYAIFCSNLKTDFELMHLQSVNQQGLPNARIFGMPTSPNPFTRHMNLDLILTLLLTLCKHICVTNRG
jgi:hypothetical protein